MASSYLSLNVHIVFATKGRAPMITEGLREELHGYICGTVNGLRATAVAVGGVEDHVHLLVRLKATHSVADVVRETKKASSAWMSERLAVFRWQEGYAAFTVGASDLPRARAYVLNQLNHHRKVSSADELRALLLEAGIELDERFFE